MTFWFMGTPPGTGASACAGSATVLAAAAWCLDFCFEGFAGLRGAGDANERAWREAVGVDGVAACRCVGVRGGATVVSIFGGGEQSLGCAGVPGAGPGAPEGTMPRGARELVRDGKLFNV